LLFEQFAREARSLEPNDKDRGFFYEKLGENQFRASWHDINEFILRKDYTNHWEVELQEEYGYFTREDFLRSFRENELRVNYA
jgi:hypothetical protein